MASAPEVKPKPDRGIPDFNHITFLKPVASPLFPPLAINFKWRCSASNGESDRLLRLQNQTTNRQLQSRCSRFVFTQPVGPIKRCHIKRSAVGQAEPVLPKPTLILNQAENTGAQYF